MSREYISNQRSIDRSTAQGDFEMIGTSRKGNCKIIPKLLCLELDFDFNIELQLGPSPK